MKKGIGPAFTILTVLACPGQAWSNVKTPGDDQLSILTRYNPAYDPQGIRAGDFIISPSISNSIEYNDNVYATSVDQMHDFLYKVRPSLNIHSDFTRHEISAGFSAERGLYHDLTSENYTDYSAMLSGRVDITGETSVPLSISYDREHSRRGSPDERFAKEPTVYKAMEASAGLVHKGQTLAMKAITDVKRYLFDNTVGTTETIDNGDRDRNEYSLYTSIGMAEEAFFAPYIYSNIKKVAYDRKINDDGYQRSSNEYEVGVGSLVHVSDITRASFNVGYVNRDIDDSRFSTIGDYSYGLNLIWEPSTLAAFMLEGKRNIDEANVSGAAAAINSLVRLSMNYELFPNVNLTPSVSFDDREYQGIDRNVKAFHTGLQMTYKLNPNMWLSSAYQYTNQYEEGGLAINEYKSNTYNLSLKLQF